MPPKCLGHSQIGSHLSVWYWWTLDRNGARTMPIPSRTVEINLPLGCFCAATKTSRGIGIRQSILRSSKKIAKCTQELDHDVSREDSFGSHAAGRCFLPRWETSS